MGLGVGCLKLNLLHDNGYSSITILSRVHTCTIAKLKIAIPPPSMLKLYNKITQGMDCILFCIVQVKMYFEKWKAAHERNEQREQVLAQYIMARNHQFVACHLSTWRSCLLSMQVRRLHNTKLVSTILMEWHVFAVREYKLIELECITFLTHLSSDSCACHSS